MIVFKQKPFIFNNIQCTSILMLFCVGFSSSSSRNKGAFSVVADAINSDYGGQEQCPWSPAQLRG